MDCSLLDQLVQSVGHMSVLIICPTMAVNYTTLEKQKLAIEKLISYIVQTFVESFCTWLKSICVE